MCIRDRFPTAVGKPKNLRWYDESNFSRNGGERKSPHSRTQAMEWVWDAADDGAHNPVIGYKIGYQTKKRDKDWGPYFTVVTNTDYSGWEESGSGYYAWVSAADFEEGEEVRLGVLAFGRDGTKSEIVFSQPMDFGDYHGHQMKAINPFIFYSSSDYSCSVKEYTFKTTSPFSVSTTYLNDRNQGKATITFEGMGKTVSKDIFLDWKDKGHNNINFNQNDLGIIPKTTINTLQYFTITLDTGYTKRVARGIFLAGKLLTGGSVTCNAVDGYILKMPKVEDTYDLTDLTGEILVVGEGEVTVSYTHLTLPTKLEV